MSNECSLESANRVVPLHSRIKSEEGGVAVAEQRVTARRGVSRAAIYLAHTGSHSQGLHSQEMPPVPERQEKSFWSSAFDFLAEGFANCGASLHPLGYFNVGGPVLETEVPSRGAFAAKERRMVLSLVPIPARTGGSDDYDEVGLPMASQTIVETHRGLSNRGRVVADKGLADRVLTQRVLTSSDALPSQESERPKQWNWLRSCWESVVTLWAHLRREREIRQAIDTLAQLDDPTLKDIGIHHRGQIEHAVRNGHDC